MKIVFISMITEPWGGSEELWYETAKVALADGCEVWHVANETSYKHAKVKELIQKGLIEIDRPMFIPNMPVSWARYRNKLRYLYRKYTVNPFKKVFESQPDVIVYNGLCYSIYNEKKLLSYLEEHKDVSFVLLGHLNNEGNTRIDAQVADVIIRAYRRANKLCFVSERSRENAEKQLNTTIDNYCIVRNPVNMPNVNIVDYPSDLTPQMACVGNLVMNHKGQDILIELLAQPHWLEKPWHLNIYGRGADEAFLRDKIRKLQIEDRVTLHGRVNDIRKIWEDNHLLLMPSHKEGAPLALVEAMLCGRPSVVTDVGGNSEWVTHGTNGFIAKKPTVMHFETALLEAFSRQEEWVSMGIKAHETALEKYDSRAGESFYKLLTGR